MRYATLLALLLCTRAVAAQTGPVQQCGAPQLGSLQPITPQALDEDVTVPVFFHVVQSNAGVPALSSALIEQQVAVLNDRFGTNNTGGRIRFRLAGISYTRNERWHGLVGIGRPLENDAAEEMKDSLNVDPAHVLNVYVTETFEETNYASFPSGIEQFNSGASLPENSARGGVVVDHRTLPGQGARACAPGSPCENTPKDEGETLAHEVGHFFGLIHTFQCGCSTYSAGCTQQADVSAGDLVYDTLPHAPPEDAEIAQGFHNDARFCSLAGTEYSGLDPSLIQLYKANVNANLMGYLGDDARSLFTPEQHARAESFLRSSRPSMRDNPSGTVIFLAQDYTVRAGSTYRIASGTTLRLSAGKLLRVEAGAVLALDPGARVEMGSNAQIASWGRIDATGTQANPIRFVRAVPSQQWREVTLLGDGNLFEHVVFDGGEQNLTVASRNNTFRNVRSVNGWRGLSTWWTPAGTRSSYTLINSVVEINQTVGVVTQYADATIVNSAIEFNGQAGLYFYQGTGYALHGNRISANGYSATRAGIELYSGSAVSTNLYGNEGGGLNRIASNSGHEVYLDATSTAYLGSGDFTDDHNAIFDPSFGPGGANKLVYNGSPYTVVAEGNYWGVTGTPDPGYFHGSVQYFDYPLQSDPTTGRTPGSGAPSYSVATTDTPLLGGGSVALTSGPPSEPTRSLRARVARLRERLAAQPDGDDAARTLFDLYTLTHLGAGDATGARGAVGELLGTYRGRLEGASGSGLRAGGRSVAETALYLSVVDAMRGERYGEAAGLLAGADAVESADLRRALGLHGVGLLTRTGKWDEADALIGRLRADGGDEAALAFVESEIARQRGRAAAETTPADPALTLAPSETLAFSARAYPNPFRTSATVRFGLPEASAARVEVYDVLGRRVALLVDEHRAAGTHEAAFDGGALPAGVYLYRVSASGRALTGTLTLAR